MKTITLTTDFGTQDGYAGILKGVIWQIAPDAQVADLSHTVKPQDILGGALVLGRSAPYFPQGTVHLAVVDPGVGTARRALAARLGGCFFVGPDNGLLTLLYRQAERSSAPGENASPAIEIVCLDQPRWWRKSLSRSFHGRDIFAPVAAHLANGVALAELGTPIHDPVLQYLPMAQVLDDGWRGQVLHIDHFGNVATNIERKHLAAFSSVQVRIGVEIVARGLVNSFGDAEPGRLVAMIDSDDRLALCVVNGNAARRLGVQVGDVLDVLAYS
jgi:S-adenosyl-L-methionine hydrolase (adenosine-forming)